MITIIAKLPCHFSFLLSDFKGSNNLEGNILDTKVGNINFIMEEANNHLFTFIELRSNGNVEVLLILTI